MKASNARRTAQLEDDLQLNRWQLQARRALQGEIDDLDSLPDQVLHLMAYGYDPFNDAFLNIEQARKVKGWYDTLPAGAQHAWFAVNSVGELAAVARQHGHPFAPAGNAS